ncbi:MAG: EAL domain-containing protein [Trueperaceae bacterium]
MPIDCQYDDDPLIGLNFQFQPILGADGKRLLAYETLVRRSHKDGTIEGPAGILPALMKPNRIEAFTRYSLEFALTRLDSDPYLPALSVNLSPRQVELAVTNEVIARAPIALRRRLMVELTEDPIYDHISLTYVLHGLTALGVRIFLDDITPRSAQRFTALRSVVHGLKLDRSLLASLAASNLTEAVTDLIDAANKAGLLLVAEGVEDTDVLPRLAARGIAFFQGFALGEPWSEPKVARRRILAPRSASLMPEPEFVTALAGARSGKLN